MTNKQYAIAGLLAPVAFWTTYFALSSRRTEYSFRTKAISELGSVDAPDPWIWNVAGYILPGILVAVFAVGLYRSIARGRGSRLPLLGILLSGVAMALSGVFPGDFDNRQSPTMLLHSVGSFGSYLAFLLGAFTYPKLMRTQKAWKGAVVPGTVCAWLTIAFGAWPFIFPDFPAVGQRAVFLFYFLWIALHVFRLYNAPEDFTAREGRGRQWPSGGEQRS